MKLSLDGVRTYLSQYGSGDETPASLSNYTEVPDRIREEVDRRRDDRSEAREISLEDYDPRARLLGYDVAPEDWTPVDPIPLPDIDRDEEIVDNYQRTVREEGFEAFAFYLPFHYHPSRAGIYLREAGIFTLATRIYLALHDLNAIEGTGSGTIDFDEVSPTYEPYSSGVSEIAYFLAVDLAIEILIRHEWFHHQLELLTAYLEDARDDLTYVDYYDTIYEQTFPTADCIEESLANASTARSRRCGNILSSKKLFDEIFERIAEPQPPAYKQYDRFADQEFTTGCKQLVRLAIGGDVSQVLRDRDNSGSPEKTHIGSELPLSTNIASARRHGEVPVYVLASTDVRNISTGEYLHKTVQLSTDYTIERTETWKKSYRTADGALKELVDRKVSDLEQNVDLPGFNWKSCGGNRYYGRLNEQFRFVVDRDDRENRVKLVDLGGHDIPREYGCY